MVESAVASENTELHMVESSLNTSSAGCFGSALALSNLRKVVYFHFPLRTRGLL